MNVFTTDHPLVSEPPAWTRRLCKTLFLGTLVFVLDLLLLGPLSALEGRGYSHGIPSPVLFIVWAPSAPVWRIPVLRETYWWYLDWWYHDDAVPYSSPYPWTS
jgi:hypothetical protein